MIFITIKKPHKFIKIKFNKLFDHQLHVGLYLYRYHEPHRCCNNLFVIANQHVDKKIMSTLNREGRFAKGQEGSYEIFSYFKQNLLQKLHVGTIFLGINFSQNEYKLLNKISRKNFELTGRLL
jgi:hypothetical protein